MLKEKFDQLTQKNYDNTHNCRIEKNINSDPHFPQTFQLPLIGIFNLANNTDPLFPPQNHIYIFFT